MRVALQSLQSIWRAGRRGALDVPDERVGAELRVLERVAGADERGAVLRLELLRGAVPDERDRDGGEDWVRGAAGADDREEGEELLVRGWLEGCEALGDGDCRVGAVVCRTGADDLRLDVAGALARGCGRVADSLCVEGCRVTCGAERVCGSVRLAPARVRPRS